MNKIIENSKNKNINKFIFDSNISMEKYIKVKDLPKDWEDNLGDNLYLKKNFLSLIEKIDNSEKSYYVFRNINGKIDTQFIISKTADNDIAMFTPFKLPVVMHSVYFPFTLSKPGGVFGDESKQEVTSFLKSLKGYKMILNVDKSCKFDGFACGLICPRCVLKIKWNSFDEYMASLRTGYRRRYNIALDKSKKLKFHILEDNKLEFTDDMYNLYLDVYNNASYKLGKVSIDFFRQDFFVILALDDKEGTQGFAHLHENDEELIFEFVGFNRKNILKYDTYIRLLVEIVRYGIEKGFKSIDFGQTADDAKLKLGCKYENLYALINHSNPMINFLCKKLVPHIQYKSLEESKFHVFKESKN